MIAAVHDDIDAGIIDVNLGGEFVYPVADVLIARKIPFVFVTGYGVESIEGRFGHVPIVKKPVQHQALQRIFIAPDPAAEPELSRLYSSDRDRRKREAAVGG
jgi:hypothetical protein